MPTGSGRTQVLDMLKEDHKRAKKHFRDIEKMDGAQAQACFDVMKLVCDELEVHTTLEEELFYPAARAALQNGDAEHLLDEAEVEHKSAKSLIAELRELSPDDPMLKAHFKVLGEYVKHHIKEEEGELFEKLERAKIDWEPLLQEMKERQQALKAEKGLDEEHEAQLEQMLHPSARSRSAGAHAKAGR